MDPLTVFFLVFFNAAVVLAMVMAGITVAKTSRQGMLEDHWKDCESYIQDINLLVDQYCNDNKRDTRAIEQRIHRIFSKMQYRMQYLDKWQCREIHDVRDDLMRLATKSPSNEGALLSTDD